MLAINIRMHLTDARAVFKSHAVHVLRFILLCIYDRMMTRGPPKRILNGEKNKIQKNRVICTSPAKLFGVLRACECDRYGDKSIGKAINKFKKKKKNFK